MRNILFTPEAWDDYQFWLREDRRMLKRINALIADIQRGGYEGLGKPEPLRGDLSSWWSRRINDCDRLVYRLEGDLIVIVQCRTHYGS
ncbi:MAG: Txe/YoeB family addiction module toxin [Candidatus Fimadaptatus sp.]